MTDAAGEDGPGIRRRMPHALPFLAVAAAIVAVDQATKAWALRALADGPIDLVGSLRFRLVFNDGAAFSAISGRTTVVSLLALVVSLVILRAGLLADRRSWALALGVILGGAAGNLVDRVARAEDGLIDGRVIDFIDLQWYPVFNVADIAISCGVVVALLLAFRDDGRAQGSDDQAGGEPAADGGDT